MSIIKEFKEFAVKGNALDLAVGVIIGAAFGKIVSSMVADVIMPPLGLLIGGIDFSSFALTLKPAEGDKPAVLLHYGLFLQNVFDFLIVALVIFGFVKLINTIKRKQEETPKLTADQQLLTEIRDLLQKQASESARTPLSKVS